MHKWTRINHQPCLPIGEDGTRVTACDKHIQLSRKVACEGMVLLKNNGALPLKKSAKIAVFGNGQFDYVKGGGGSGYVTTSYYRNIYQGLKIKQDEGKVEIFEEISDFYKKDTDKQYATGKIPFGRTGLTIEPEVDENILKKAKDFTDTAIVIIKRYSREEQDRSKSKDVADYYLDEREIKMIDKVCSSFKNVIIVLNVGGIVDTSWFANNDKISSVLLSWQAGIEGGLAVADILCGDENPSGKLTDTFAVSYDDYPSSQTFDADDSFVEYTEDIYVGYRYFETIKGAKEKVVYPFGYGLSYTNFEISNIKASLDNDTINVSCDVKNIGNMAGKEVVQVYYSAPCGVLGKPARSLAGFAKTKLLEKNESESISILFKTSDMASYDDIGKVCKSAYILEKGDYEVFVGNSVRNTVKADFVYTIKEDYKLIAQLSQKVAPTRPMKRLLSDGTYEELPAFKYTAVTEFKKAEEPDVKAPEKLAKLIDVHEGKVTLDEFMAQLTTQELAHLLGGQPCTGVANTCGMGNLAKYGIPNAMTVDGPAGVRTDGDGRTGIYTTCWPCCTLVACTWNTDIAYEIANAGAKEVKENNLAIWLTPGLNIHRNPLCGRNFEYYSEDPLISGKMAVATVLGIQKENIAACVKHLCCNNKEVNRKDSDSRVSERALREIYLKGFEIAVRESNPWLVMTSYNLVNSIRTSENYELITGVLRDEWGYKGLVCSDWLNYASHAKEVISGNDIRMPIGNPQEVLQMAPRSSIYERAKNVLTMLLKLD